MTWWIGRPWKWGNPRSEAVLRAEGAVPAPSGHAPHWFLCSSTGSALGKTGRAQAGRGAVRGGAPPVPIPNTVVKRPSADDTGGVPLGQ